MTGRLLLVFSVLVMLFTTPVVQAQPPAGARLALNRCGAGDTVQYTLAVAGAVIPDALIPGGIETPSYTEAFAALRPFLTAADLAMATLAGPLAGEALPALAPALAESNLLLLGTAQPRLLALGPTGVDATLQNLSRYGIFQHGAVSGGETHPPFLKVTVPHPASLLTLGFLSASWGLEGNTDPRNQIHLLANTAGVLPNISAAIEQARQETDLVVVMAAWGQPTDPDPPQARINAARNLIAAGADLVIGSIPGETATVDWVRTADREGLVIFSAGDLIGTATTPAALMYIGVTRDEDGAARVSGLRYLPITPGNGAQGPTPLPTVPREFALLMGDPGQLHAVPPVPPTGKIEVCPALVLPEAPQTPITGDFARFYQTFGGEQARSLIEGIALLGLPLGPVTRELAGDCRQEVAVLYTERQRLELHPGNDWPNRVLGSHVGVVAFRLGYPDQPVTPRTDLSDPSAFADPLFRSFYERYGGISVFGYPISGALTERDPNTGRDLIVQYFERARFERDPMVPLPADPLWQVRLGLLGREVGSQVSAVLCPTAPASASATALATVTPVTSPVTVVGAVQSSGDGFPLLLGAVIVVSLILVGLILSAIYDLYLFSQRYVQPAARSTRSGYRMDTGAHSSVRNAWQESLRSFSRRDSQPEPQTETTKRSWLGKMFKGRDSGQSSTQRQTPGWRQPTRTASRNTQPPQDLPEPAVATGQAADNRPQTLRASLTPNTSRMPAASPPSAIDPLNGDELAEWFDTVDEASVTDHRQGRLDGYIGDQPVEWNDLPPAERERWLAELGPLTDDNAADVPPAEWSRWQNDLAGTTSPMAADLTAPTTPNTPFEETTQQFRSDADSGATLGHRPDDDDLLRKLLGIY